MRSTGWEVRCWAPAGGGASRRAGGHRGRQQRAGQQADQAENDTASGRAVPTPEGGQGRGTWVPSPV